MAFNPERVEHSCALRLGRSAPQVTARDRVGLHVRRALPIEGTAILVVRRGGGGRAIFSRWIAQPGASSLSRAGTGQRAAVCHDGQEEALRLDMTRVQYWIDNGAQQSDTVKQLVKQQRKAAE